MPRFKIDLIQKVFEEATLYVDAPDADAAQAEAIELALAGAVEWRFLEAPETPEIVGTDQVRAY